MEAEIQSQIPNIDHVLSEYSVVGYYDVHYIDATVLPQQSLHNQVLLGSGVTDWPPRDISIMHPNYTSQRKILLPSLRWLRLLSR